MNRPTNTALKIAGIAMALSCLSGVLVGCGGSDSDGGSAADAPKGASTDASEGASTDTAHDGFCKKFNEFYASLAASDPKDTPATIKRVKAWVGEIEDYGTPSDMSDEAREGFEILTATFKGVADDATLEEFQSLGSDASAADNKKIEAFGNWTTENCAAAAMPSPSPS